MAHIDSKRKILQGKIVYYGPGLCGKTTNLEHINKKSPQAEELMSLSTAGDRTIFFDFMPLNLGTVGGVKTTFKLYTVPGQVRYNRTRKMVLKNVDGIVFVADSQRDMIDANLESLYNLFENLEDLGIDGDELPVVLQYNKQDLPGVLSREELDKEINTSGYPVHLASAVKGDGVLETLDLISSVVFKRLAAQLGVQAPADPPTSAAPQPAKPAPAPSPAPASMGGGPDKPAAAPPPPSQGAAVSTAGAASAATAGAVTPGAPRDVPPPLPALEQIRGPRTSATLRAITLGSPQTPNGPRRALAGDPPPSNDTSVPVDLLVNTMHAVNLLTKEVQALAGETKRIATQLDKVAQQVTDLAWLPGGAGPDDKNNGSRRRHLTTEIAQQRALDEQRAEVLRTTMKTELGLIRAQLSVLTDAAAAAKAAAEAGPIATEQPQSPPAAAQDAAPMRLRRTTEVGTEISGTGTFSGASPRPGPDDEQPSEAPQQRKASARAGARGLAAEESEPDVEQTDRISLAELREAEAAEQGAKAADEPAVEEPAAEEPAAEEPAAEEPAAEEPAAEEPAAEEPAAEEPAAEEAAAEEPAAEEPAAEEPAAEEPAAEEPAAEEPDAEEPAAEEPAAEEPAAEEPDAEEPDAEEPAAEEPDAEEPAAEEPAAEEPDAEEPAAEEPDAEEPDAEEPAAEEPDAEEPAAEEPVAASAESEPAPAPEPSPAKPPGGPEHRNAARIARVMVADLKLYYRNDVDEGVKQGDFHERLKSALGDMRSTYEQRVPEHVRSEWDHLSDAVNKLIGKKRKELGLE